MPGSELGGKVGEREEGTVEVEAFDILAVRALDLAVVSWGEGTNAFVHNTQAASGVLEEGGTVAVGIAETVGELEAVVGLDALDLDS